jgi:hypothetical protein
MAPPWKGKGGRSRTAPSKRKYGGNRIDALLQCLDRSIDRSVDLPRPQGPSQIGENVTPNALIVILGALTWLGQTGPAGAANVAVLMPGSGGIVPNDFLVRNEGSFRGAGIRTIMTTSPSSAAAAIAASARARACFVLFS